MTTMTPLTPAKDLVVWSTIRLFTPLGGTYAAMVSDVSVEPNLVTLWVQGTDGAELSLKSLVCSPTFGIEVIELPDLTPYGKIKNLVRIWQRKVEDASGDDQWAAAGELLGDLEALLDTLKPTA